MRSRIVSEEIACIKRTHLSDSNMFRFIQFWLEHKFIKHKITTDLDNHARNEAELLKLSPKLAMYKFYWFVLYCSQQLQYQGFCTLCQYCRAKYFNSTHPIKVNVKFNYLLISKRKNSISNSIPRVSNYFRFIQKT